MPLLTESGRVTTFGSHTSSLLSVLIIHFQCKPEEQFFDFVDRRFSTVSGKHYTIDLVPSLVTSGVGLIEV